MGDNTHLKELVKSWIQNEKELEELQIQIKFLKLKKKEFSSQLVSIMEENDVDMFNINNNAQLIHKKSKVKSAISKKYLLETLPKFIDSEEEVSALINHIMTNRTEKITDKIEHKVK